MKNIYIKSVASLFLLAIVLLGSRFASADELTYSKDLTIGSSGDEVVVLQTWLEANGYLIMPAGIAKGYFGAKTRDALASYQKSIGYPAYGFFGPMTREHFNKGKANVNSLNIISPNGGETWQKGTTQTIRWNSPQYFKATNVDIWLIEYKDCSQSCTPSLPMKFGIIEHPSANSNSYSWKVAENTLMSVAQVGISSFPPHSFVPDGDYVIQICESGTSVCTSSKKPFNITSQVVDSRAPVINSFNAPTTLTVGQTGTWTINATDPQNSSLSYSVNWGDVVYSVANADTAAPASVSQISTYTHSYSSPGTYTVRVFVRNSAGLTAQSSATVQVTSNNQSNDIKVISPNGGETWIANSVHQIMWTNKNTSSDSKVDLYLTPVVACPLIYPAPASCYPKDIVLDKNISTNTIYNWIVGTDTINNKIPAGSYTVKICKAGTTECDSGGGSFNIN